MPIEAVGNGNPAVIESFQADRIKAFSGQCLLIVRSKYDPAGPIDIEATTDGCEVGRTTLETR